ncbi:MAG: dihydropteroate synthase [Treponema sp.]|nr:dihydropteroate synthase [Treponema sp.]
MKTLFAGKKILTTDKPAFVMGILNVTPDSFYEKSRGGIERAAKLIEAGADIIDVGGESTRPGFTPVSAEEEIKRVVPVIKELREKLDFKGAVSIDTTKFEVLKAAVDAGADIFNDVSAFEISPQGAEYCAKNELSVVLMHHTSGTVQDVVEYLKKQTDFALKNGISKEKIIWDPGIGFGKSFEENIELIKNTQALCGAYPLLMALSRKRCIGQMTNQTDAEKRLSGTVSANLISVLKGASIIRVHDVEEAVDSLNTMKYLM